MQAWQCTVQGGGQAPQGGQGLCRGGAPPGRHRQQHCEGDHLLGEPNSQNVVKKCDAVRQERVVSSNGGGVLHVLTVCL